MPKRRTFAESKALEAATVHKMRLMKLEGDLR